LFEKRAKAALAICKNIAMKKFVQRLNLHRSEFCQNDGRNDESKIISGWQKPKFISCGNRTGQVRQYEKMPP
jgi:hypothetical protein